MKIELRNVKYAKFASQETDCFEATVYVDGVKAGTAENDGHGGCTMIHPWALAERLNAYGKTLPPVVSVIRPELPEGDPDRTFSYEQDAETLIGDQMTEWHILNDYRRLTKNRILFTKKAAKGIYQSSLARNGVELAQWLASPNLRRRFDTADKILNLLPQAEALAIFREQA